MVNCNQGTVLHVSQAGVMSGSEGVSTLEIHTQYMILDSPQGILLFCTYLQLYNVGNNLLSM